MPVIFQDTILRADLEANPETLYLFGDNERRFGKGGQAREMRGMPNAVGVRTKRDPGMNPDSFWSDARFEDYARMIDNDLHRAFVHIRAGGTVVIPTMGIGTGLAQLPMRAPRLMEHIRERVREMIRLDRATNAPQAETEPA